MKQTAIGFEYIEKAMQAATAGTGYNPVVTIGNTRYSFHTPSLGDVEAVTKLLFTQEQMPATQGTANLQILSTAVSMFTDIHMHMQVQEINESGGTSAPRAAQRHDLDRLQNPAHVLLFKNIYLSLCLFFILKSDGYTITF